MSPIEPLRPLARLLAIAVLTLPAGCGGDGPAPAPAPAAGGSQSGDVSVIPPVLTATQRLAAELGRSTIAAADLPPGATASEAVPMPPSPRTRAHHAEAKVTFDIEGANDSDKVSYTVYPTREDAIASFASIGEPVADRSVLSSEPIALADLPAPVWGESTTEEYQGKRIARSVVATVSGSTVVLAQSIVAPKDDQPPVAATAYVSELLRGGVRHLEKLAGTAVAPGDAGTAAPGASAAPPAATP